MEATQRNPAPRGRAARPFTPTPFRPARWLPGPHAQTVAGRYLRPRTGVEYRRERIDTPDGDFLDLDWATVPGRPAPARDAPLVAVVHGLEGSAQSLYVLETCRKLWDRGIRSVAMNFRSCSGEPNRLPRFYHAGDTGDIAHVLELMAARNPGVPLGAVGFSLGANVLLKYLGERGGDAGVRAAAAISIPFDLGAGADGLNRTRMGRLYTRAFIRPLQAKYRQKRGLIGGAVDERRAFGARSFREFDDAVTARLHGFRDVDDYYGRSSSAQFLPRVAVPTLLVHAADDPFVPAEAIPHAAIAANPSLVAAMTEHGGHVGFIAGTPWAPEFWAEAEAARFLAGELKC
ncbi:YheT family hydrolase [Longimicrobium sp.]|uniref:YheT family hydrolase n=1 Tax=Longimicrobium sp. TaxID=2029185 RepID=UPI002C78914B|nr:alpha/beta fold hydrolase [Longimicrobium sp.]HSU14627.1 alpha/beta fold hydrolase [Longimicrobium sp.]